MNTLTRTPSHPSLSTVASTVSGSSADSNARRRHKQKDDAIRRKVDHELSRKTGRHSSRSNSNPLPIPVQPNAKSGTVAALRPSAPVTIRQSVKVLDAAQLMAARRCDALLVVDHQDRLCGIITDKDLAFRVVAEGLDMNTTKIFEVMTKNVQFCNANQTASEALSTMIAGGFRHLPVMDDEGDVVGVLDITKCLYDALNRLDTVFGSTKKLTDALEDVQRDWATSGINAAISQQFELLRQKIGCPDLNSVLASDNAIMPPEIGLKATVRDAARAMKHLKSTAALVFDDTGKLAGIFTSKDIVLRVMSVKADPTSTSIIRVMTPHPDTVSPTTSINTALKMMHTNRYLHLPVKDPHTETVVGLVDVLMLTYNVLDKMHHALDAEGRPAWNEFWTNTFTTDGATSTSSYIGSIHDQADSESVLSGHSNHTLDAHTRSSSIGPASLIRPQDSASMISESMMSPYAGSTTISSTVSAATTLIPGYEADQCFIFKFCDPTTMSVHRVTSPINLAYLVSLLKQKLGNHIEINSLSYTDEDGDDIVIESDGDLNAAVTMIRDAGLRRLVLKINGITPTTNTTTSSNISTTKTTASRHGDQNSSLLTGMTGPIDSATDLYAPETKSMTHNHDGKAKLTDIISSESQSINNTTMTSDETIISESLIPSMNQSLPSHDRSTLSLSHHKKINEDHQQGEKNIINITTKPDSSSSWWSLSSKMIKDNGHQHPMIMVGLGVLVTLSVVGMTSLIRK